MCTLLWWTLKYVFLVQHCIKKLPVPQNYQNTGLRASSWHCRQLSLLEPNDEALIFRQIYKTTEKCEKWSDFDGLLLYTVQAFWLVFWNLLLKYTTVPCSQAEIKVEMLFPCYLYHYKPQAAVYQTLECLLLDMDILCDSLFKNS